MVRIISCPICGAEEVNFYTDYLSYSCFKCIKCKHIFVEETDKIDYSTLYARGFYDNYAGIGYLQDFHNYTKEHEYKLKIIKELLPRNGEVIEIGCGPGLFLDYVQRNDIRCVGVELNEDAVEYGREVGCSVDIVTSDLDLKDNPLFGKTFDLAIMFATIEHVAQPKDFIKLVSSYLKPGGHLILDTGIRSNVGEILENGITEWLEPPYHLHVFSDESMRTLLAECGFRIIKSNTKFNYNMKRENNIKLFIKSLVKKILFTLSLIKKNKNTYKGLYICQKLF